MPLDPLANMPSAEVTLTTSEAYRAMLRVLEYYFRVQNEYPVCNILSDLAPGVWADGSPGDPAAWQLWLQAVANKVPGSPTGA